VHYLYRSLRFPELVALYSIADIALITPLRDGMNLVAKEYVASRAKPTGVLILSEMAGAAKELGDAILVNPAYQENLIRAFVEAVDMPLDEQERRMRAMQLSVRRRNSTWWAEEFTSRLEEVKKDQKAYLRRLLLGSQQEEILKRFAAGPTRLLILDYDGTLVPYVRHPQQSDPGPELLTLLGALARMPNTEVVVASGRRRENLEQWFDGLPIGLIGEHGMWMRKQGGEWTATESFSTEWKNDIRPPLERYVDATPGSFLEEKDFSLAWHYRLVDPELWKARVPELLALLGTLTQKLPLQVRDGQRVIEVKSSGMDKGRAAQSWLVEAKNGFILAAGDDWTDEDLFAALPETAFSIRVGLAQTRARAFVHDWQDIVRLLKNFQTFRL
jgi:trehalose 6-phosphate synthase/phosphatase